MKTITLIIFLFCSQIIFGCDCQFNGGFLKTSYYSKNIIYTSVIDHLQIFDDFDKVYYDSGIKLKVIESIKGQIKTDTISIYWSYLSTCSPSIDQFQIGTNWLFAIDLNENIQNYLKPCITDYVKVADNHCIGTIIPNDFCDPHFQDFIHYDTMKNMIDDIEMYLMPKQDCEREDVFLWVTDMPKFKLGEIGMDSIIYFGLNLETVEFKESEYLYVEYIIEENGHLSNISISNYIMPEIATQYFEKIKKLLILNQNQWVPGKHFNKTKRVKMIDNINLTIIKNKYEG